MVKSNALKDLILPIERPEKAPQAAVEQSEILNNEDIDTDKRLATKTPYFKIRNKRNRRNKLAKLSRRKNRKHKK
jgi:hypothetical protein